MIYFKFCNTIHTFHLVVKCCSKNQGGLQRNLFSSPHFLQSHSVDQEHYITCWKEKEK